VRFHDPAGDAWDEGGIAPQCFDDFGRKAPGDLALAQFGEIGGGSRRAIENARRAVEGPEAVGAQVPERIVARCGGARGPELLQELAQVVLDRSELRAPHPNLPPQGGKELSVHRALAAALPDADPVKALEELGFGESHREQG